MKSSLLAEDVGNFWSQGFTTTKYMPVIKTAKQKMEHHMYDTPARLIKDIACKSSFLILTRDYTRNYANSESAEYEKWQEGDEEELEPAQFFHRAANPPSYKEVAFQGFKGLDFSDLPKCDMRFTVDEFDTPDVSNCLNEMKSYFNGENLHLYKTKNSFHVYFEEPRSMEALLKWRRCILGNPHIFKPSIVDLKWVEMNKTRHPLRVSACGKREIPRLYAVL